METKEAKETLINAWGTLGTSWGVSRTMAQIHALLLVSATVLSADDIMEALQISRGNVNMSVRDLMDWGLVKKVLVTGERREYFEAEKDIHKVAMQVAKERKKRELEPMLAILEDLKKANLKTETEDEKQLAATIENIHGFANRVDQFLSMTIKAEQNWFWNGIKKFF